MERQGVNLVFLILDTFSPSAIFAGTLVVEHGNTSEIYKACLDAGHSVFKTAFTVKSLLRGAAKVLRQSQYFSHALKLHATQEKQDGTTNHVIPALSRNLRHNPAQQKTRCPLSRA